MSKTPEPSSRVGFAGNNLIRDSENRDETSLRRALAHHDCRFYVYNDAKVLVRKDDRPTALFTRDFVKTLESDMKEAVLLGVDGEAPRVAVPARIDSEALEPPLALYDLRSLLYSSSIGDKDAGAIAQGGSLLAWHAANRFCGRCGAPTRPAIGGYRRDCSVCDHKLFPRTDPVVIMLAADDDQCLLGRSPHFQPGWFSTLAGFVEPGETIEDAVRRETFEESGIRIGKVRYYASQPWPFPHSLMIGVHCEAISRMIVRDTNELEDCRWFSREDIRAMIAETHPRGFKCPPSKAIAHALIRAWVDG